MKKIKILGITLSSLIFIALFESISTKAGEDESLIISYPYDGAVFPAEIAPPSITWHDGGTKGPWEISIMEHSGKSIFKKNVKTDSIKIDRQSWEHIKAESNNEALLIEVKNTKNINAKISISISKDSVNAPVFYRDVPLPFSYALRNLPEVRWRIGNIASDSLAPVIMENLPVCGNCHSFSADGSTIAMDVDAHSGKDAYGIAAVEKHTILHKMIRWSYFQDGEPTYALLSNLSPNGRYIASTLKDNEFFVVQPEISYSQLFFPIKGIMVIYDQMKDKYFALPGADDTAFVQSNPNWTPDGKTIYFAKAKAINSTTSGFNTAFQRDSVRYQKLVDEFYSKEREFKYDIYTIPFNDGKGGRAVPLKGASANKKSNYFPKISPDGKWVVFNQAENFMLLQPDSKLFIMPAEGGTPRLMNCNLSNMNSWHSWSPNGRWLVFASKEQGPYTKLYLTHIDEKGNDSPPVLLENMWLSERAANIPEFVNVRPGEFQIIEPKFLENDYFSFQNGVKLIEEGKFKEGIAELDKAAASDPKNFMVYGARGFAKAEIGDKKAALDDYNKALELKPNDFKLFNLRGFVRLDFKDYAGAIEDFTNCIKLNPNDYEPYRGRGYANSVQGKPNEAIKDYNQSIALNPDYLNSRFERGLAYYQINKFDKAVTDFSKAISIEPKFALAYFYRGICKAELGKKDEACKDLNTALEMGVSQASDVIKQVCK